MRTKLVSKQGTVKMEERREREGDVAPPLPKLVMDWCKILRPASRGYVDLLKMAIERLVEEGTARLVRVALGASGDGPPAISLSIPVVQATWGGHTAVVSYLVERFSDIVAEEDEVSLPPNFEGWETRHCCGGSSQRVADAVVHRHGPYMASHIAASLGHVEILRVWGESCVEWRDDLGHTPLHWAACYGQKMAVQYLLSIGAPVNATNIHGVTPLVDCMEGLKVFRDGHGAHLESLILLLDSGATINDSHLAACVKRVAKSFESLTDDETESLLSCITRVNREAIVPIAKLFCMHLAPNEDKLPVLTRENAVRCFIGFLHFMSFACQDLSQVHTIWDCVFQLEAVQEDAAVSCLPPFHTYGNRMAITSWAEAESVTDRAQLTSDLTEVVYQCALMLERALGSDSPCVIETLFNAPTLLALGQSHPSKALESLFLHAAELFNAYLLTSNQKAYTLCLLSPVGYLDKLMERNLDPDFLVALKILLKTLKLVIETEIGEEADRDIVTSLKECSYFLSVVAFDLLCRVAYLSLRGQNSMDPGQLPHEVDELALQLVKMCPPLDSHYYIRYRGPSWLAGEEEEDRYVDWVTECFQSWLIRTGSLYTLDEDGDMVINIVIEGVIDRGFSMDKPLLDFVLEHASHHDAVDSSNKSPHEMLMECKLNEKRDKTYSTDIKAVCSAITNPPSVPPLTCLTAQAIISHRLPYGATDYLPPHIVRFISMHDFQRKPNSFISHVTDFREASQATTEFEANFDIPFTLKLVAKHNF